MNNEEALNIIRSVVGQFTKKELSVMEKLNDCYIRSPLSIFVPSIGICEYSVSPNHSHPGYSFIISLKGDGRYIVEGKNKHTDIRIHNPVVCFSPGVEHQEIISEGEQNYIAVFIQKRFYEKQLSEKCIKFPAFKGDTFSSSPNLISYCRLFIDEYENKADYKVLDSLTMLIAQEVLRISSNCNFDHLSIGVSGMDDIIQFIYTNYHRKLTVKDLAERANCSEAHFSRLFRQHTKMSPIDFLLETRLTRSRNFLKRSNLTISETALNCGFSNPSHFSSMFKRRFGISPRKYKQSY